LDDEIIPIGCKTPLSSPLDRGARSLHEENVFNPRLIYSSLVGVVELIDRDREWIVFELFSFMMEDLFIIHLKKVCLESEFLHELSFHSIMERFSRFHMSSWEYPWSLFFVLGEEDFPFRIEDECADDRGERHKVINN
jgi:hypothetical protein